jgi:WD40 repeat protein
VNTRKHILPMILLAIISLFSLSPVWSAQPALAVMTVENAAQIKELTQLKGHTGPVFSLAFSPDGKSLVSGGSGSDYTAVLWDVVGAAQRATLTGHTAQIAAVGFNADGSQVLTASYDATIRTWDTSSGAALETINQTADGVPFSIENLNTFFSADGSKLVYGTDSGFGTYIVDMATRQQTDPIATNVDLMGHATTVGVSADGKILAMIDDQGIAHVYDVESLAETATLTPSEPSEYGGALAFSKDGKTLAVSNYDTSNIQIWNLETNEAGALLTGHAPNDEGTKTINSLSFSPDGTLLASASYDNTIRIWDVSAGKELVSLDANQAAVVTFCPDGTLLASSDVDGIVHLWGVTES